MKVTLHLRGASGKGYRRIELLEHSKKLAMNWSLRYDHNIRRKAADRFLGEHLRFTTMDSYRAVYELEDGAGLTLLVRLLNVDIRTKDVIQGLTEYAEGEKTLEETYRTFLPLLVSEGLTP